MHAALYTLTPREAEAARWNADNLAYNDSHYGIIAAGPWIKGINGAYEHPHRVVLRVIEEAEGYVTNIQILNPSNATRPYMVTFDQGRYFSGRNGGLASAWRNFEQRCRLHLMVGDEITRQERAERIAASEGSDPGDDPDYVGA